MGKELKGIRAILPAEKAVKLLDALIAKYGIPVSQPKIPRRLHLWRRRNCYNIIKAYSIGDALIAVTYSPVEENTVVCAIFPLQEGLGRCVIRSHKIGKEYAFVNLLRSSPAGIFVALTFSYFWGTFPEFKKDYENYKTLFPTIRISYATDERNLKLTVSHSSLNDEKREIFLFSKGRLVRSEEFHRFVRCLRAQAFYENI